MISFLINHLGPTAHTSPSFMYQDRFELNSSFVPMAGSFQASVITSANEIYFLIVMERCIGFVVIFCPTICGFLIPKNIIRGQ